MKRRNRGKTTGHRINEEEEEKGAKDRTLGESTAKTEGRRERRAKRDYSTSIRKKEVMIVLIVEKLLKGPKTPPPRQRQYAAAA